MQVGVVIRGLEQVHGRGHPEDRRLVHSADIRSSAKSRAGGHIEAHGQIEVSVRADGWERKREWLREVEVHVVREKAAELAHIAAIGINLIGIIEIDGHLEPERLAGVGHVDAQAIPGIAIKVGIAPRGPTGHEARRAICQIDGAGLGREIHSCPACVVEAWLGPNRRAVLPWRIAGSEFPRTGQGGCRVAEGDSLHSRHERCGRGLALPQQ